MELNFWNQSIKKPAFPTLDADLDCDVLVVGGGIAGILTAYFLQEAGRRPIVVEAKTVGGGITSKTTAVVTAQHDTPYRELIEMHGVDAAKAYLDANLLAVEDIKRIASTLDCDFEIKPSYLYSRDADLSDEFEALKRLDYDAELTTSTELPFSVKSAVKFDGMAQFHPLKFLYALAKKCTVYENTTVLNLCDNVATTDRFRIRYRQAVVATHFPFLNRAGLFFAKMYQNRSYVAVLEGASELNGTYVDDKTDGFYWRNYGKYLLLGKGDHRTGTRSDAFAELERCVKKFYPEANVMQTWANQDCITLDAMPYVGKYGSLKNVWTLTGFNLWGMTGSAVGARILTDLIIDQYNPYAFYFRPDRKILRAQLFQNFAVDAFNLLRPFPKRCPHLGCALRYNPAEHSWDCMCHGSRFAEDGSLLDNPATEDALL